MRYRSGTYPSATMHSFIIPPLLLLSRCPCTIHALMDNCFLWRWTSTGCTFPEPGPLKTAAESATPPPNTHSDVEPLYRCSAASPVEAPGHSNTAAVTTATPPRTNVHAKSFRRHSTGCSFATTGHITTGAVRSIPLLHLETQTPTRGVVPSPLNRLGLRGNRAYHDSRVRWILRIHLETKLRRRVLQSSWEFK